MDFEHFVSAQRSVYDRVTEELRQGHKATHWMWFIFPQIIGLGRSETARRFALTSVAQAEAYLAHPVLGPRLTECCRILLSLKGLSAEEIFGYPDDLKLRSSMTLFARTPGADPLFQAVLDKYYGGEVDPETLARL